MNGIARFAAATAWILCSAAAPSAAQCVHYEQYTHPVGMLEVGEVLDGIAVSGSHAYVTDIDLMTVVPRMFVMDISDPAAPRQLGSIDIPWPGHEVWGIAAVGSLVLLTNGEVNDLLVIDAGDPASPRILAQLPVPGLEWVAASGSYAYLTGDAFRVVDISDPAHPSVVASIDGTCYGIALAPPYAYLGGADRGLLVIDISDPRHPAVVATLPTSAEAGFVSVSGARAYLSDFSQLHDTLRVVDVSDPRHPRFRGSLSGSEGYWSLAAIGDLVYAVDYGGLRIIDARDPDHPAIAEWLDIRYWQAHAVVAGPSPLSHGTDAYVVGSATYDYIAYFGWLFAFHAGNVQQAQVQGMVDSPGPVYDIAASGTHAYVAAGSNGIEVVDAGDPAHPAIVGTAETPGVASGIATAGRFAYVADESSGLQVVDVGNPASPAVVGGVDTPGTAWDVAVEGSHTYVADGASGLEVIDVADPAHPWIAGSTSMTGDIQYVAVSGEYAYVTGWGTGFQVVQVSDPTNPRVVGSLHSPVGPGDVEVSGGYAYVVASREAAGLFVIDVQAPTRPRIAGSLASLPMTFPISVAVTRQNVYVATGDAAVEVCDPRDPQEPRVRGWLNMDPRMAARVAVSDSRVFVSGSGHHGDRDRLLVAALECEPTVRPPIDGPIRLTPVPLATARPNPMRHATTLQLSMPASAWVRAEIWDVTGRLVRTLHDGLLPAGPRDIAWNGRDQEGRSVPAGIYWIRVEGAGATTTRRLVVLR